MNFKYNNKYFKAGNIISVLGFTLVILALILFLLDIIDVYRGGMFLAVIFVIIGAVMVVFSLGGKSSDADIDEQIKKMNERLVLKATEKFGINEKNLKPFPPFELGSYDYSDADGLLFKKGSDGHYRSSKYVSAVMLFTLDRIFVYEYKFSIADENSSVNLYDFTYAELDKLEVVPSKYTATVKDKLIEINYDRLTFKLSGGKEFSMPVHSDSQIDELITNIFRYKKRNE